MLDERSFRLIEIKQLVHQFVADGCIAAPKALPELGLRAVHALRSADVIVLLGHDQLHVFHARAKCFLVVDRCGRRLDDDAILGFEFLLQDNGLAALTRETRVVVEDEVSDLVGLPLHKCEHLVELLAETTLFGTFPLVAEFCHDLQACPLGKQSARPCLNVQTHAALLLLAGYAGVEDTPFITGVGLLGHPNPKGLEQVEVIHAHSSFA